MLIGEEGANDDFLTNIEDAVKKSIEAFTGIEDEIVLDDAPAHVKDIDFGLNVVGYAKKSGWPPVDLASSLAANINEEITNGNAPWLNRAINQGPFVNLELNMDSFGAFVVERVLDLKGDYGKEKRDIGKKVVVDMSSPNIAKRMSYGHLRSTVIGAAVANLYEVGGYEVIRDNHIGDWGTQFGKLIVAIEKWGSVDELKKTKDPIGYLQELYVKFHDEADKETEIERSRLKGLVEEKGLEAVPELTEAVDVVSKEIMERKIILKSELNMETVLEDALDRVVETELDRDGREACSKLEKGDKQVKELWKMCVEMSMKEFEEVYRFLGVEFDVMFGESFYEDKLKKTMELVEESGCGEVSEGALVMKLEDKGLGVAIIRKSDGASVYMTRDLACAIYRSEEMKANSAIYVVGEDQKLYFRQLFEILKRMGYEIGAASEHVYFGMVKLKEGKMSTRKGRTILLKDVIEEGVRRTEETLKKKKVSLSSEDIRRIVAGALKWNDLGQDAKRSMVFDWDEALNMQGYSAPYVQYAVVRAKSLLKKAGYDSNLKLENEKVGEVYKDEAERGLVKMLMKYPRILVEARKSNDPSKLASFVYSLAKHFGTFYNKTQIIGSEDCLALSRLKLVDAVAQVIESGLDVLGIEVPKKM